MGVERSNKRMKLTSGAKAKARRAARSLCAVLDLTEVEGMFLPSVVEAKYRGDFRIHLTFNDSSSKTVDFRSWLKGPVFASLKQASYFRRFFLDGGTVVWPNGADIAPETLYEAPGVLERPQNQTQRTRSAMARRRSPRH